MGCPNFSIDISTIVNIIIAAFTVKAACAASKSAKYASQSVEAQKEITRVQIQPALSIYRICEYCGDKEDDGYPVGIILKNTGGGTANLKVIDTIRNDVNRIDIGVPTIIGSQSDTNIRIWLKETNHKTRVRFCLYYWDITNKMCYRTILVINLQHTHQNNLGQVLEVLDQVIQESNKIKMPKRLMNWRKDREDYYDKEWLSYLQILEDK